MRGYVKRLSKKAEKLPKEQLLSLLDDVVEENEGLYSILESLSTGLLIVNEDFILLRNNMIVESQLDFKYYLDDPRVSQVPVFEILDDEEICSYLEKCYKKGITNSSEDFSTVTSGGTIRFLTVSIMPLVHESELSGRIILVRDITDKKKQDVLVHRMENLANLTNLAAGMAHEIKNPLGAISIHIQLIKKAVDKARENEDKLPGKKFVEDHISIVNEEIDHLNKLVMDFLMAVRPVKAQLELKNPGNLIKNVSEFFAAEFANEKIQLNIKVPEDGPKIMLDEKLFREVILNLSQNALAAIKSRREKESGIYSGLFGIEASIIEEKYVIKISDNGCGMSPETVSKIFEPYFTTKANGTGLGMTMVYKIVKEFSGEIIVDSHENEGTTFTIVFPIPQKNTKLLTTEAR